MIHASIFFFLTSFAENTVQELAKQAKITVSSEWRNNGIDFSRHKLIDGSPDTIGRFSNLEKYCFVSQVRLPKHLCILFGSISLEEFVMHQ